MVEPPAVRVRRGEPRDAEEIARLWYGGWRDGHLGFVPEELVEARTEESFRVRAQARVGEMAVAEVAGAIAGFVLVVEDELEQVYVSPEQRGTGVAGVLLAEAERQLRENGHERGWLAVVPGNARARAFYERNGWWDEGPVVYQAASERGPIGVPCRRYVKRLRGPGSSAPGTAAPDS